MVVKELVDVVNIDPAVVPKDVVEAIGHRMKDRRVSFPVGSAPCPTFFSV